MDRTLLAWVVPALLMQYKKLLLALNSSFVLVALFKRPWCWTLVCSSVSEHWCALAPCLLPVWTYRDTIRQIPCQPRPSEWCIALRVTCDCFASGRMTGLASDAVVANTWTSYEFGCSCPYDWPWQWKTAIADGVACATRLHHCFGGFRFMDGTREPSGVLASLLGIGLLIVGFFVFGVIGKKAWSCKTELTRSFE